MIPQVDFDSVDSILRVLEGWELGNEGLYTKYQACKKIMKISKWPETKEAYLRRGGLVFQRYDRYLAGAGQN